MFLNNLKPSFDPVPPFRTLPTVDTRLLKFYNSRFSKSIPSNFLPPAGAAVRFNSDRNSDGNFRCREPSIPQGGRNHRLFPLCLQTRCTSAPRKSEQWIWEEQRLSSRLQVQEQRGRSNREEGIERERTERRRRNWSRILSYERPSDRTRLGEREQKRNGRKGKGVEKLERFR